MSQFKNWNCDGDRCTNASGEVRVYSLGAGGNLILCHSCWARENQYRYRRGQETGAPENFPQQNWHAAEVYDQ